MPWGRRKGYRVALPFPQQCVHVASTPPRSRPSAALPMPPTSCVQVQHCPCPPGPSPASLPHLLPSASLLPATLALFLVLRHISCFLCLEGWPQDSCSALPYLESHLSTAFPNPLSKLHPPSTTFVLLVHSTCLECVMMRLYVLLC